MAAPKIQPIDESRPFEAHELFFSTTDRAGVIRYGNDVFCRIAGYPLEDMLGKPHNIIRHPEMPRAVFRLLWSCLEQGRTVAAYVRNMASDGRYYWVLAIVMPCGDGFLSIRLKPGSELFDAVQRIYPRILNAEKSAEANGARRQDAIDVGEATLHDELATAGFATYDDFMHAALTAEMMHRAGVSDDRRRPQLIARNNAHERLIALFDRANVIDRELGDVFARPGAFTRLRDEIIPKSRFIQKLGRAIQLQALNAQIESAQLGDEARALAMVAEHLGRHAGEGIEGITALNERMQSLTGPIAEMIFSSLVSKVQIEMAADFVARIVQCDASSVEAASEDETSMLVESNLSLLFSTFLETARRTPTMLETLHEQLIGVGAGVETLQSFVRTLHFIYFAGSVETAKTPNAESIT